LNTAFLNRGEGAGGRAAFFQEKVPGQTAPDPADKFKTMKRIVCIRWLQIVKTPEKFQHFSMLCPSVVEEKTGNLRMKGRKDNFLIDVPEYQRGCKKAGSNGKYKNLSTGRQLTVSVKYPGIDKKSISGCQSPLDF